MDIYELNNIIEGKIVVKHKKSFQNIQTDTRKVNKKSLLFVFDLTENGGKNGYDYLKQMKVKPAIIVINECEKEIKGITCIKVKDTIKAYSLLASYYKNKRYIPTIVITGSVGKTTTKDLIYNILSSKYNCLKTEKSQNSILGVSNTLMKINSNTEVLIIELGTNHIGEIKTLSDIVKPDIGVITKIGTSHIEYFKTKQNIFKEKTSFINNVNNGILFINGDDKYLNKIKDKNTQIYKIGHKKNNDFKIKNINIENNSITFKINNFYENFKFNTINKDLILNASLAISIGLLFNIPINKIKEKVQNFIFPKGRNNTYCVKDTIIIDDTYNASKESVISSVKALKHYKQGKIIILGDMLELGKKGYKIHKKVLKEALKVTKNVYTLGNNYKFKNNFENKEIILEKIKELDLKDKVILLKASRKLELDTLIPEIKKLIENNY